MSKALIYIVEDDPALGSTLKKILEVKGYENIKLFNDGKLCLEQLHNKPALIILDFSLETLNGLDVLRLIKSNHPKTKVVIFSSLANDDVLMQKCRNEGALACFNKNDEGREALIKWMRENLKTGLFSFLN